MMLDNDNVYLHGTLLIVVLVIPIEIVIPPTNLELGEWEGVPQGNSHDLTHVAAHCEYCGMYYGIACTLSISHMQNIAIYSLHKKIILCGTYSHLCTSFSSYNVTGVISTVTTTI